MTDDTAPEARHDPGGRVRIVLPDGVVGGARFSACGRYRQTLTRDWTPEGGTPRTILFIGMNPSVADASVSDPTCNRELGFSRRWGYTRYLKGNVLDWRATSPRDLPADPDTACSGENLGAISEMADEAELLVLACGRLHRRYAPCVEAVVNVLRATGRRVYCFGTNKDGSAKHPLYLRADSGLVEY